MFGTATQSEGYNGFHETGRLEPAEFWEASGQIGVQEVEPE